MAREPGYCHHKPSGQAYVNLGGKVFYLDHAEVYYGPGTELKNLKLAIGPLSKLYATLPAASFGPLEYKTVRQWWLDKDCDRKAGRVSRQYVNSQMKRLMRVVKFGVADNGQRTTDNRHSIPLQPNE